MIGKTVFKIVMFAMIMFVVGMINVLWIDAVQPTTSAHLAVNNLNGGDSDWQALNVFQKHKGLVHTGSVLFLIVLAAIMFIPRKNRGQSGRVVAMFLAVTCLMTTVGCMKPYDKPEYAEIGTSQTAFLIPLEGDAKGGQAKFNSAEYLEARKVASKRIQITHRWNKTGRFENDGEWLANVKVVVVDRSPITREWQSKDGADKGNDKAIWIESADSVGFSMGWTCTGYVKEEDSSQFLYMYPSGSLPEVMDTEVRARIQQVAALVAAAYKLDALRDKKIEMAKAVQTDVTEFFAKRGITITTVGMFGGMTYENKKIQDAIDQTFISQQEKVNAAAMLAAQEDKNTRIKSEADAMAQAARTKAKGEADGNLAKAQAEALGIEAVNAAIAKANNNPQLVQLKSIEVEKARVEKWNGQYPTTVVGGGANAWIGLQPTSAIAASGTNTVAQK